MTSRSMAFNCVSKSASSGARAQVGRTEGNGHWTSAFRRLQVATAVARFRLAAKHALVPDNKHELGRIAQLPADALGDLAVDARLRIRRHVEILDRPALDIEHVG